MQTTILVLIYFVVIPLGSSFAALRVDTPARPRRLWITALTLGVVFAAAGFIAHRVDLERTGYTEGSGMTPITLGLSIPLISAAVVRAGRDWHGPTRVFVAAIVGAALTLPLAAVSHYVLSGLVPAYFGCCPL